MPFNNYDDITEVKTAKEIREEQKEDFETKKFLYGAGKDGWTKEFFERIKNAYYNGSLTIGYVRPRYDEEKKKYIYDIKPNTEEQKWVSSVAYIFSEKQNEEDLNDTERTILLMLCHPITKIKVKANNYDEAIRSACVPEALKWHQETNWRHLDELMKFRPNLYVEWKMKGLIPDNVPIKTDLRSHNEEEEMTEKEFIEYLRTVVPEDSPLRQPHEDWFKEYKTARTVDGRIVTYK